MTARTGTLGALGPARFLAAVLGGGGLLVILALAIGGLRTETPLGPGFGVEQILVGVLPLYLVSVFMVWRRPDNAVSTWFLAVAVLFVLVVGLDPVVTVVCAGDGPHGCFWAANLAFEWAAIGSNVAAMGAFVLFPDGMAERRWHRGLLRWAWVLLAVPPLLLVCRADPVIHPFLAGRVVPQASPFTVPWLAVLGPALTEVLRYQHFLVVLGGLIAFARFRRADADQRRRMCWLMVAFLVYTAEIAVFAAALLLDARPVVEALGWVILPLQLLIPVAMVHGVLRHGLLGIDVVVRRSVVYGTLALGIAALYALVAAVPGLALGRLVPVELAVVLTILAALAFAPARARLDALADRWVFGERVDRTELLLTLGAALEQTVDVTELLPRIAGAVRDGLGAPWVRVTLSGSGDGAVAGSVGDTGPAELEVALERGGEVLGRIECGPRGPAHGGGYTDKERELLHRLAGQSATAIANLRLTAQLARSRERLVQAADGERRRIERDIHDGVQQEIVAVLTKLSLARNQVGRGARPADEVLTELQDDVRMLLTDLRELARGIHPPVLSDRGLVAAIRARTDRLPVSVVLHAPPELAGRRFGADVEGASYFVVCEALTNVVKHARAATIDIELSAPDGHLCVEVRDDGAGFDRGDGQGRGVLGMRDRVEALGGRLEVSSTRGNGTRVRAALPIGAGDG